jgi:predicted PurR-regulated permease PerM
VTVAIRVIAVIAVIIALALGSDFFVPLTLGLALAAILHPVVGWLRRLHAPAPLASTVAVILAIAVLALAVTVLEPPVREMASQIPQTLIKARQRLQALGIRIPGGTGGQSGAQSPSSSSTQQQPPRDSTASQQSGQQSAQQSGGSSGASAITSTVTRAFGITASALFTLVEILLLAFFVLGAGELWREKLRESIPSDDTRRTVLDTIGEIRDVVARYLFVNVIINAAQAVVVALIVWALGYPSPILWGIVTFIAEFVPYFGGATVVGLLLLTGIAQGRGLGHALLAPAAYLVITTLQNNLVSPVAYGRSLKLNPTAILVGVIFWAAVWGIAGVFLAVPLLAAIRIVAERTRYRPLAIFLAD